MAPRTYLNRRHFVSALGAALGGLSIAACDPPSARTYSQADINLLAAQRAQEEQQRGTGPYGDRVYWGYRGLAELPWFDLDDSGQLRCIDDHIPLAIDVHCHLGMSVLFKPQLDLLAKTGRVKHLLDCDASAAGCPLDLDIYINGNFSEKQLADLRRSTLAQGFWGSDFSRTQTIPNLLREMTAMRIEQAFLLPIKIGLPFGDDLTEQWHQAVLNAAAEERLHAGISVHPNADDAQQGLRKLAQDGARIVKLHPTVQRFYPDDAKVMELYAEAEKLGLVVFFHGGRAGIEPESSHAYAMPRHYEAPLAEFPRLQFILGHAGARDGKAMLDLAIRYENAWLGIHGQSLTQLEHMIQRTRGARLLFGSDWPFYHIGASLAKVLITTDKRDRESLRRRILRDNALQLFPEQSV